MGLRARLLEIPIVYETLQNAVVRPERKSWLPHCLIEAKPGMTVLDVGCGTGKILTDLPEVTYVGIDHNRDYVAQANYRHGLRGRFLAIDANNAAFKELGQFDRILLIGVLHHLSDEECLHLLPKLHEALAPDGLLVTYDNAIAKGQHPIARLLAKLDRGRYARSAARYRALIEETFAIESETVRHDLLRVPYTIVAFRARRCDSAQTQSSYVE